MFKIIEVEDDMFVETSNLRVGKPKNINLNYSAADVAWNHNDGKAVIQILFNSEFSIICFCVCVCGLVFMNNMIVYMIATHQEN